MSNGSGIVVPRSPFKMPDGSGVIIPRSRCGGRMRLYYEIAVRSFQRATTYRSAYIAGLLTNAFFGAVLSFVYLGVYGSGGSVAGMSAHDAVSYVWIMQSMISIG